MHLIFTSFSTSYISYTTRGKRYYLFTIFPSYTSFQTGGGKRLWIGFTWTRHVKVSQPGSHGLAHRGSGLKLLSSTRLTFW